jgi:monoamine oxidase
MKNRTAFLRQAQRPSPHLWVVGEGMSRDQGWTEGALDSVRAVLADVLKK